MLSQTTTVFLLFAAATGAVAQTKYTYTTFSVPNSTYTNAVGINEEGDVSGYYGLDGNALFLGFLRSASGQITTISYPGQSVTAAYGLNDFMVVMDTISMFHGHTELGVVTGKPLSLGGSKGRNEATARGCQYTTRAACEVKGFSLDKATVAVQGFGNAGSIAAKLLHEDGARILAVSDSKGGIYNGAGLDPVAVMKFKDETSTVVGFPGCDFISNKDLLELKCDVLVPAALENTITMDNVERIKAKIVAEAANGPTTPSADKELFARGVLVIPDILCNAGGVTVSYFEWVQDLYGFFWTEMEVNKYLERTMNSAFKEVYGTAESYRTDMRTGAYILAVSRVAEATRVRGIFP